MCAQQSVLKLNFLFYLLLFHFEMKLNKTKKNKLYENNNNKMRCYK